MPVPQRLVQFFWRFIGREPTVEEQIVSEDIILGIERAQNLVAQFTKDEVQRWFYLTLLKHDPTIANT